MSSQQQIQNLISQAKYLQEHNQQDSDKYSQIYEELSKNQNGQILYDNPQTKEIVSESLNDKQIFQVRQQVLAYKYLIRNMPLPKELEKNIYSVTKDQWEIESERIMQKSLKFYNEKVEKNQQLKQLIKEKTQKRDQLAEETDKTSQYFIEKKNYFIDKRKMEIQKVLQQQDQFPQECVKKLVCELKMLNSLDQHKTVFSKVQKLLTKTHNNNPDVYDQKLLDRNFYKREKPAKKISDLNVEKFELNIRVEQQKRKKKKHFEFLRKVQEHQEQFQEFHRKNKRQLKRRAMNVRTFIENLRKKEQELADKEMQKRVKALREDDWDEYQKLILKTKNSRITELLKKTDDYIKGLGEKVLDQKGGPEKEDEEELDEEMEEDVLKKKEQQDLAAKQQGGEYSAQDMKNVNQVYYQQTHTKTEKVITQPTILVGGKLKSYQLIGLEWMISLYNNKLNGILADEMGLGKTIQTISLICYLIETKKNPGPFLVVIPLSTMSNWVMEFERWAPSVNAISYKGSPGVRKDLARILKTTKWHVVITTYEYILKDKPLLSKYHWKYIIVDEGHRMKNSKSKFAQVLGQQYNSDYRILLTGTPLQNNLGELWALLNFLLPKVFKSCEEFEKWFSIPVAKMSLDNDEAQLTEEEQLLIITRLHQVLRPFVLRRVKKEVEKELPDKEEYIVKVELSCWQRLQEKQIQQKQQNVMDPETGRVQNKALMNLMMQLRKIANHPYLFQEDVGYCTEDDMIWRVSGKFELLDRIIPKMVATNHKILIFTQMTKIMDIMDHYFTYRGWKFLRLDGSTKEDERSTRMKAFNAPNSEYQIFILSTRAGGLGLNLQTADTVVIFDSDWNPQQDLQAQDRAHRIGQKNQVKVLRFVTNTVIEKEILDKSNQKKHLDDMIIQTGMYNTKATDTDRQKKIEEMLGKGVNQDNLDDDVPNDEDINNMVKRSDEEFELFQQMDAERYEREKLVYPRFQDPRTFMANKEEEDNIKNNNLENQKIEDQDEEEQGQEQQIKNSKQKIELEEEDEEEEENQTKKESLKYKNEDDDDDDDDDEDDDEEEQNIKKKENLQKQQQKKIEKNEDDDDDENDDEVKNEEEEQKNNNNNTKIEEEEEQEQQIVQKKKKGRKPTSGAAPRKTLAKMMDDFQNEQQENEQEQEKRWVNYRLCELEDVPSYIQVAPVREEKFKVFGRGHRSRKDVEYNDDDAEDKFLKTLQMNSDQERDYEEKNKGRRGRFGRKVINSDDENNKNDQQENNDRGNTYAVDEEELNEFYGEDMVHQQEQDKNNNNNEKNQYQNQIDENINDNNQNYDINIENNENDNEQKSRGRGRPPAKKRGRGRKPLNTGTSSRQQYSDEDPGMILEDDESSSYNAKSNKKSKKGGWRGGQRGRKPKAGRPSTTNNNNKQDNNENEEELGDSIVKKNKLNSEGEYNRFAKRTIGSDDEQEEKEQQQQEEEDNNNKNIQEGNKNDNEEIFQED